MDYYNDFQRIIRSDDIAKVIDRYLVRNGRDCADSRNNYCRAEAQAAFSAADGFEVSEVIPFEITSSLIPEQFRALVTPLLFDEAHPSIKVEFTKEDVYALIDLFTTKTVRREVKI